MAPPDEADGPAGARPTKFKALSEIDAAGPPPKVLPDWGVVLCTHIFVAICCCYMLPRACSREPALESGSLQVPGLGLQRPLPASDPGQRLLHAGADPARLHRRQKRRRSQAHQPTRAPRLRQKQRQSQRWTLVSAESPSLPRAKLLLRAHLTKKMG